MGKKNKTIELKPGNYWFFGLDIESTPEQTSLYINEFIDRLPIKNKHGWCWKVGNTLNTVHGVFSFRISRFQSKAENITWERDIDFVSKNYTFIDYNQYININTNKTNFLSLNIETNPTACNESCAFYWSCDGDRKSVVNPSVALGLPCEYYCFNKNKLKINE